MKPQSAARVGILLSVIAGALLVMMVMLANIARLGSVIANEVRVVQLDYLQQAGPAFSETTALKLGQCLRREMLKWARAGFVHSDTWAVATRLQTLPLCQRALLPATEGTSLARAESFPSAAAAANSDLVNVSHVPGLR